MNELLATKRVDSFTRVLGAYNHAGVKLFDAIDGGAGSGAASQIMLQHLEADSKVFAFEPFPGNHRFFSSLDQRIFLYPMALAEADKSMKFQVSSVVSEDSAWGKRGMAGYSSVGYLVEKENGIDTVLDVECVAADKVISSKVSFVKLDLQGGELNALKGMKRILENVSLMWVEYTGQQGLYSHLLEEGFILFDTEYFFMGPPTDTIRQFFDISKEQVPLSTGKTACFGFKKKAWGNFEAEFHQFRKQLNMIQTDLVCVNRRFLDDFLAAIPHI